MKTALYELHKKLGASFTNFMGYEMPLKYTSIQDEHLNVRHKVGIFDVSHMGNIMVKSHAEKINRLIVGNAEKLAVGNGEYTLILNENGDIIDDEVYFHLKDGFFFIPNSGMNKKIMEWFSEHGIEAIDLTDDYSIIAIQGPESANVMKELTTFDVSSLKFFDCAEIGDRMKFETDARIIVSRSGYTGERGYELYIKPAEEAVKVFEEALERGKKYGIKPAGLGARDSLRLEKCFMLAGNEFEGGRNPFEVGLEWTINWEHDFIGKNAILEVRDKIEEKIAYLECIERGIPRHGNSVIKNGKEIGRVSSGGFSPCLQKGIAMAFVKKEYIEEGNEVVIKGLREIKARMVKPPFVKKGEC